MEPSGSTDRLMGGDDRAEALNAPIVHLVVFPLWNRKVALKEKIVEEGEVIGVNGEKLKMKRKLLEPDLYDEMALVGISLVQSDMGAFLDNMHTRLELKVWKVHNKNRFNGPLLTEKHSYDIPRLSEPYLAARQAYAYLKKFFDQGFTMSPEGVRPESYDPRGLLITEEDFKPGSSRICQFIEDRMKAIKDGTYDYDMVSINTLWNRARWLDLLNECFRVKNSSSVPATIKRLRKDRELQLVDGVVFSFETWYDIDALAPPYHAGLRVDVKNRRDVTILEATRASWVADDIKSTGTWYQAGTSSGEGPFKWRVSLKFTEMTAEQLEEVKVEMEHRMATGTQTKWIF